MQSIFIEHYFKWLIKRNNLTTAAKKENSNCIDFDAIKILGKLSPAKRVRNMLEAQKFAMSIIRGRVRREYPDLSKREINIKVFEEIYKNG